jgi:hypothetical protein
MKMILEIILHLLLYGIYGMNCAKWASKEVKTDILCIKTMFILLTIPSAIMGTAIISNVLIELIF